MSEERDMRDVWDVMADFSIIVQPLFFGLSACISLLDGFVQRDMTTSALGLALH